MRSIFTLVLIMSLLIPGAAARPEMAAPAQVGANPGPANHMLYDARLRQVVLLTAPKQPEREAVWGLDGKGWQLISGAGPAARDLSAAAYDARRKRVILHGGLGFQPREERRGDTWEWDGKDWREMTDTGVGTRDHHAMAYDEARGRAVLFGGTKSERELATDTWEWDGVKWTRVATDGPGGRAHFGMVYDSQRKQVVIFGGLGEGYKILNDTWAWDGKTWRKLSDEGPPRRSHLRMAFDSRAGEIVLFGGLKTGRPTDALDDTWIWDGRQWKESPATGPSKRSGHVMAYDEARGKTFLYGGGYFDGKVSTSYSDTWEWDGRQWTQVK